MNHRSLRQAILVAAGLALVWILSGLFRAPGIPPGPSIPHEEPPEEFGVPPVSPVPMDPMNIEVAPAFAPPLAPPAEPPRFAQPASEPAPPGPAERQALLNKIREILNGFSAPGSSRQGTEERRDGPAGQTLKRQGGLAQEIEWWGYRCGITNQRNAVIRNYEEWDEFREDFKLPRDWIPEPEARDPRLRERPPRLPEIDFEKMIVVGIFLGRVVDGYRVEILSVAPNRDGRSLEVEFGKTLPLPNPIRGAAFTEPYHIKVIRRFDGEVNFWQKP